MATRVGPLKNLTDIIGYVNPKNPDRSKDLGYISYTRRVICDFVLNLIAMATWVVRRICLTSFNSPTRKPLLDARILEIFLIAYFVPNFVAMVARVGHWKFH